MTLAWAIVFFLATLPLCVLCAAFDLTRMRIPNWVVLALFACFLVLGPLALPLPELGWRLLQTAVVLLIGFLLTSFLGIGGGDGKFAAAAAAFIAPGDYGVVIIGLAVMSLLAVWMHRALGNMQSLKPVTGNWASFGDHGKFPFGLPLATTLVFYNMVQILNAM